MTGTQESSGPPSSRKPDRLRLLRDAIEKKSIAYASEARVLKEQELRDIQELAKTHAGSMPNNYWLPRHRAEAKLFACLLLLEALDEAIK